MSASRRKKLRRSDYIKTVALIVTVLVCAVFIYFSMSSSETDGESTFLEYNGNKYLYNNSLETTLILGLDSTYEDIETNSNTGLQNDFILLVIYNSDSKQTDLLAINRDTMADVNEIGIGGDNLGTTNMQLALAYNYGDGEQTSCRNVRDAVSNLLNGIRIDHYVAVTMDAVSIVNDELGGVTVDDTYLYGEDALEYVRARKSLPTGSNIERMQRQVKYEEALFVKLLEAYSTDKDTLANILFDINKYMYSDLSIDQLEKLLTKIIGSNINETKTIEGINDTSGEYVKFYLDEDDKMRILLDIFYE